MKKILLLMLICGVVKAALPPSVQSDIEIKKIIESQDFLSNFGNRDRVTFERTETGYTIKSDTHHQDVEVINQHNDMLGPVSFDLNFKGLEKN